MKIRERLRLKWVYFTTYMRYQYHKIRHGPYVCETCGDYIDKQTTIEQLYADLTEEEMACRGCLSYDDYYPEEEYEYDPEYSEEEPYIDDEEMWMR